VKGVISTIQRYSLRDGPGIRSTVFLVGCNLHCLWCSNPELIAQGNKVMVFHSRCTACGACLLEDDDKALFLDGKKLSFDSKKKLEKFVQICPYQVFKLVGETLEAYELAQRLKRDLPFYENSNGGVSFSGGEPLLQSAFIAETASFLKESGINITVDTAGHVDYSAFERINPFVDLYLYDLKGMNSKVHKMNTGEGNELILSNLDRLIKEGKKVTLRMVVVPGRNDSSEEFKHRLELLQKYRGKINRIDLLKVHDLGRGKYMALGLPYLLSKHNQENSEQLNLFTHHLQAMGFDVHCE